MALFAPLSLLSNCLYYPSEKDRVLGELVSQCATKTTFTLSRSPAHRVCCRGAWARADVSALKGKMQTKLPFSGTADAALSAAEDGRRRADVVLFKSQFREIEIAVQIKNDACICLIAYRRRARLDTTCFGAGFLLRMAQAPRVQVADPPNP